MGEKKGMGQEKAIELMLQGEEHFSKITDLTDTSLSSQDILISPDRFNFGCFDAASGEVNTLITLQATTSDSHSFKPSFVAELVEQLAGGSTIPSNLKIWHVFVLESIEQYNQFKCPDMKALRK